MQEDKEDRFSRSKRISIRAKKDINMQGVNVDGEKNRATYISNTLKNNDIKEQALAGELSVLLEALRKEATDTEHFISIGDVANAQQSVKQGNMAKAYEYLGKAGKWTLDVAQKAGTQVIAKIIQSAIEVK